MSAKRFDKILWGDLPDLETLDLCPFTELGGYDLKHLKNELACVPAALCISTGCQAFRDVGSYLEWCSLVEHQPRSRIYEHARRSGGVHLDCRHPLICEIANNHIQWYSLRLQDVIETSTIRAFQANPSLFNDYLDVRASTTNLVVIMTLIQGDSVSQHASVIRFDDVEDEWYWQDG